MPLGPVEGADLSNRRPMLAHSDEPDGCMLRTELDPFAASVQLELALKSYATRAA